VEVPDGRIAVARRGTQVILSHAIAHRHANPCDFSGQAPELDSLVDFHVELEPLFDSLPAAVRGREAGTPVAEKFADGYAIGTEPGFLEAFEAGGRKGYRILLGAEGCGETVYYLADGPWTLRAARRKVAQLDPITAGSEAFRNLPGVIAPGEAEDLVARILASARIVGPAEKAVP
jgi:hypothetical protein